MEIDISDKTIDLERPEYRVIRRGGERIRVKQPIFGLEEKAYGRDDYEPAIFLEGVLFLIVALIGMAIFLWGERKILMWFSALVA